MSACPSCATDVPDGARFCENCGAQLAVGDPAPTPTIDPDADPMAEVAPISALTRRPIDALPDPVPDQARRPCPACGGEVGPDLYCTSCGTKAPSERDHFREEPADWVAGVCDRGIVHSRNEDAMALLAAPVPGSRAVLVVLDGVSNSIDSDVASLAGARAAREVLRMPMPAGMGTPQSKAGAVAKVFTDAVAAANTAIIAVTDPDSPNPASATFAAAVLENGRLNFANVGDSRAYWLPDDGEGVQLTVDDSIAQVQIAQGIAREVAENSPHAHAITKWLGRDAEDIVPRVGSIDVTGDGWVLVCSDGLWNYASEPAALQAQIKAAGAGDPVSLALALVEFANKSGGQDNITAALARVGTMPEPVAPPAQEPKHRMEDATVRTRPAGAVPPPPPPPTTPPAAPVSAPPTAPPSAPPTQQAQPQVADGVGQNAPEPTGATPATTEEGETIDG